MTITGLEQPCATCGRISGDHTLREWSACLGKPAVDLPYEPIPDDLADAAAAAVRQRFQLDEDMIVADHVVVRAGWLDGSTGPLQVKVPALFHEFQIGASGRAPVTVAKVVFLAEPVAMRAYGRLARDSANGAANAAERG